jgi:hypothetical protein
LASAPRKGLRLFDSWVATDEDLDRAEAELNVRLPAKYREFMRHFGGGEFLFVDLLTVNRDESPAAGFVAVAPVGTGDWWGFVYPDSSDFLEFMASKGLRAGQS